MKTVLQWLFVVFGCGIAAYYLNWIAYCPAASQDGTIGAVLRLATRWYGIPMAVLVQLLIWWVMPTLFRITPSPWLAAIIWPLISAVCKVVIVWTIKPPTRADWITIVGFFTTILVSWYVKMKEIGGS